MKSAGIILHLLMGLVCALVGGVQFGFGGLILGGLIGVISAEIIRLRERLAILEKRVAPEVRGETEKEKIVEFVPLARSAEPRPVGAEGKKKQKTTDTLPPDETPSFIDTIFAEIGTSADKIVKETVQFFTGGNLVLKAGLLILFFGFSFLLKYAAQRDMLPIEFRLVGVGVAGISLLVTGWLLRIKKSSYGLVLQGGGVGVLYLVVYAAARLYGLLPEMFSLGIMIALVALSCCLAVIQESKSLAIFSVVGGFLAPVLMSSEAGNHVLLFSYFALINCGIFGIAWYKSWRELNLIGFIFTFGIGTIWGRAGYQPEFFYSTEPFLVIFFVFYLIISILFASRQPLKLKGYIDGPLVFGLPLVAAGLQYWLVRDTQYGMAFTALVLGFLYLLLAKVLFNIQDKSMGLLAECFLALGVMFATLTVPLALDGHWAASIWALEGAGMVWVGVRQQRTLARLFGILLQLGAAFIFIDSVWYPFSAMLFLNHYFLGCLFLAIASMSSSYFLDTNRSEIKRYEHFFITPLLAYGLIWLYLGGVRETERQLPVWEAVNGFLLYCSATSIAMGIALEKWKWQRLTHSLKLQLPMMVGVLLYSLSLIKSSQHLFSGFGGAAWVVAFVVQYRLLYLFSENWSLISHKVYHLASLYLAVFITCYELDWLLVNIAGLAGVWPVVCWAIIPGAMVIFLIKLSKTNLWPFGLLSSYYLGTGWIFLSTYLVLWFLYSLSLAGKPEPLSYFPLFNPLEATQIFVLFSLLFLANHNKGSDEIDQSSYMQYFNTVFGLLIFLFLNSIVARSIHVFGYVPYNIEALYKSVVFQAAISALWGGAALSITAFAANRGSRLLWSIGAGLLCLVVGKLFFVDLSSTGTIARIVSFLVVGVLMLIIGYVAPIPPKQVEEEK